MIGRTLSHYKILSEISRGGMGIVYRAHDLNLDRVVALKVLPPELVSDPQRRRRFVQEARAASAFDHPNIVTIHDIAEADGEYFIVMQYVEGKTLGELIGNKGLKLTEALRYAVQMADGLAAAHARGIVHRDLKPGNVVVTEQGQVKLLDFGLAKLTEPDEPDEAVTRDKEHPLTKEGHILGTAAYMSPEQAQALKVDARSDIFSFGSVLYEMITGRRAFGGDNMASVMAAIIRDEPERPSILMTSIPLDLEKLITRTLRKEKERRFQSMADLRVALEEIKDELDSGSAVSVTEVVRAEDSKITARWTWLLVAAALLTAIGLVLWKYLPGSDSVATPLQAVPLTSFPGIERMSALSPDGNQVAFMRMKEGDNQSDIYVQLVGGGEPLQLTDSPEDEWDPTWSPDGQRIAFLRRSGQGWDIYTIHALGGVEKKISSSAANLIGVGLSWSPDGEFLAIVDKDSPEDPMAIYLLNMTSGEKRKLTTPPEGGTYLGDRNPRFSPDGKQLAFMRNYPTGIQRRLYSVSLPDGDPITLTPEESFMLGFDWAEDGQSLIVSSNWDDRWKGDHHLYRIPSSGGEPERLQIQGINGTPCFPSISRRGGRLVFYQLYSDHNIWRASGPSNTSESLERLIRSTRYEWHPQYSPDGEKIVFGSDRSGSSELWICDRDGSNWIQLTSFGDQDTGQPRWSPDGRHIAFTSSVEGSSFDIFIIDAEGGIPRRLTTEPSIETRPRWSRDGKWIYFCKGAGQEWSVWKIDPEGGFASHVLDNAMEVEESPDGNYLYFFRPPGTSPGIWRATVDGKEEIQVTEQGYFREWTLFEDGVLYVNRVPDTTFLEFHNFAAGEKSKITVLGNPYMENKFGSGVSISPDGRWFLYVQDDATDSWDIMMVENFH